MNYKGNKCISCGERFSEKSDIVVCPECGTPYHRECYKKEGTCINRELHNEKKSWKPENNDVSLTVCEKCGTENKPNSRYCENCGETLKKEPTVISEDITITTENTEDFSQKIMKMNEELHHTICESMNVKDEEIDGVKLYEMAYFVRTNIPYYLSVFKKFYEKGKSLSFNLLCFLVPHYYFANRKMYLWALISFLVVTALSIPSCMEIIVSNQLVTGISSEVLETSIFNAISNVCMFLQFSFQLIISVCANKIYCNHIIKRIKEIKSSCPEKEHIVNISKNGGTNFWAVLITFIAEIFVIMLLRVFCAVILVFLSAYF